MNNRIVRTSSARPSTWPVVSVAAVALLALTVFTISPARDAHPPGDCWGGALSADPLHCYVLNEAHREGVITIEGMYLAGRYLYIYVAEPVPHYDQAARFYDGVRQFFLAKAREFAARWPERTSYDLEFNDCWGIEPPAYNDCIIESTFIGNSLQFDLWESPYARAFLRLGGAESRFSHGG